MESLCERILRRVMTSTAVVVVSAVNKWTNESFGLIQGLCVAFSIFAITSQVDGHKAQPKLLRQVTLLYCNKQIRQLVNVNDTSPTGVFSNILMAIALAVMMMLIYNKKSKTEDLRNILEGLFYLYGDMLDFMFQYGVLKTTAFAFGMSVLLKHTPIPENKINAFCKRLAAVVSANLLSQGMVTLVQPPSRELGVLQCLAIASILRLLLPDLESYVTYLAAAQLVSLIPGMAPLFLCVMLLAPFGSWMFEVCYTYVIISLTNFITLTGLFWNMILITVLAHYIDFVLQSRQALQKK